MKTTLHYVRHAGLKNPERIVPGRIPGYGISKQGKDRAKKAGEFFKNLPIKHIYTSPLERTYETANEIAKYLPGAKIYHAIELIEVDSLHWQAYKLEELFTNNFYESFLNDPFSRDVPENMAKLAERMKSFALTLCKKRSGQEVICVSHLYPIAALRLGLEGKSLSLVKSYDVDYVSITSFEFDENCKFVKTAYKDIS
jgi:broad specificity phosphatase PhoE